MTLGRAAATIDGVEVVMMAVDAAAVTELMNGFWIDPGPPRTITVPRASEITALGFDVTVDGGILLRRQLVALTPPATRKATVHDTYSIESNDGDLHFGVGAAGADPDGGHIGCELQRAAPWKTLFNAHLEEPIQAAGFLRCLFEHPGFRSNDDAHIFEVHPIRAVNLGGELLSFDVAVPDQDSIHSWVTQARNLTTMDAKTIVAYDPAHDTLTFQGMDGADSNYVQVNGSITNVDLHADDTAPAAFTLDSAEIGHPISVICLKGTGASRQLQATDTSHPVRMVALRNIDLDQAITNNVYVINLLAIDIRPQP